MFFDFSLFFIQCFFTKDQKTTLDLKDFKLFFLAVPKRRISKKKQSFNHFYKNNKNFFNCNSLDIKQRSLKKLNKKLYFKLFSIYTFYSFTDYRKKPYMQSFKLKNKYGYKLFL